MLGETLTWTQDGVRMLARVASVEFAEPQQVEIVLSLGFQATRRRMTWADWEKFKSRPSADHLPPEPETPFAMLMRKLRVAGAREEGRWQDDGGHTP